MIDALELNQRMYRIEPLRYRENLEFFTELLDMKGFLKQAARQLSLGQKMRANLALALMHDPDVLYLDEPTIGLDVLAKDRIRCFIREINRRKNTTVMLTTHDMTDIEAVCGRLVVIDSGKKLYDGTLDAFKHRYAERYVLRVVFRDAGVRLDDSRFQPLSRNGAEAEFALRHDDLMPGEALTLLARQYDLTDVGVREIPIEEIVRNLYAQLRQ